MRKHIPEQEGMKTQEAKDLAPAWRRETSVGMRPYCHG
jgi:hypothetical protein